MDGKVPLVQESCGKFFTKSITLKTETLSSPSCFCSSKRFPSVFSHIMGAYLWNPSTVEDYCGRLVSEVHFKVNPILGRK